MKLAVAGSGQMAGIRAEAFAKVPGVEFMGVASRSLDHAQALATKLGGVGASSYEELLAWRPDALLVELPHKVQDEVVHAALKADTHVLIGGPLAMTGSTARQVVADSSARGLVVEAGYEARYKKIWHTTRELLPAIGPLVSIRAVAQVQLEPSSWYYSEQLSGGLAITHLSYCFINPLRWLLGSPEVLAARATRKSQTSPDTIRQETCAVLMEFPGNTPCTLVGGYVLPAGPQAWELDLVGVTGRIILRPGGNADPGSLTLFRPGESKQTYVPSDNASFEAQAASFVAAVRGEGSVLNPAADAVLDVELCDIISSYG